MVSKHRRRSRFRNSSLSAWNSFLFPSFMRPKWPSAWCCQHLSEAPQCSTNTASDRQQAGRGQGRCPNRVTQRPPRYHPAAERKKEREEAVVFWFLEIIMVICSESVSKRCVVLTFSDRSSYYLSLFSRRMRWRGRRWCTLPKKSWAQRKCECFVDAGLAACVWKCAKSFISPFFRFVDVLKLLHIVSLAFIHLLEQPEDKQRRLWLLFEWRSKRFSWCGLCLRVYWFHWGSYRQVNTKPQWGRSCFELFFDWKLNKGSVFIWMKENQ